jgi:hypothetical protein
VLRGRALGVVSALPAQRSVSGPQAHAPSNRHRLPTLAAHPCARERTDQGSEGRTAILSHAGWQRLFGGDESVVGPAAGLVVGLGVLFAGAKGASIAARPGAPRTVTLEAGDTLWEVATRHTSPGVDPRAFVDALVELNGLDRAPPPGTRIRLPR